MASNPSSLKGFKEHERRHSFIDIQRVDIKVSEDISSLSVNVYNRPILVSAFRHIMQLCRREASQTVLEHIRGGHKWADGFTREVGRSAEVLFRRGFPAWRELVSGFWSKLGYLQKGEGVLR
ncbi:hypothetical protein BN946_scf184789.g4 [Trametes cinnabarina]|uniref:Uncharacterized protein n=1 Tax=Pycnoporus cinnabarinus TaxID=5643 RepID=A0A060T0A9_PYCCI|nr:hypothetical protein BN946_scf184789.g4 [Trametes cinnabarina]